MRRYCIFSGMVLLLIASAEAQEQRRADRRNTGPNVAPLKPITKKARPAEVITTKKPAESEKKSTYTLNQPWSQPFSTAVRPQVRGPQWENHFSDRLDKFWKQPPTEKSPYPQPDRDSRQQFNLPAPLPAAREANRQIVKKQTYPSVLDAGPWSQYPVRHEVEMIGDPSFAAPFDIEQGSGLIPPAWPAEKPGLPAPLPLLTPPTMVPIPSIASPVTISWPTMAEPATLTSPTAPTIVPVPPMVSPVSIDLWHLAEGTPTSPSAPMNTLVPTTEFRATINALPTSVIPTLPTVNSPWMSSSD